MPDSAPALPPSAPLRVLFVIPSLGGGGSERSLVESLVAYGSRVDARVLVFHDRRENRDEVDDLGITVRHCTASGWWDRARAVAREAKAFDAQVVATSVAEAELPGRVGGILARRPVLSTVVNCTYDRSRYDASWRFRLALTWNRFLDAATAAVCVTAVRSVSVSATADFCRATRYPRSRVRTVPRGRRAALWADAPPDARRRLRAAWGVDDDTVVVGLLGRHEVQKRYDTVPAAVGRLGERAHVHIVHAGRDGAASAPFAAAVAAAGVSGNLTELGNVQVPTEDFFPGIDALAAPSAYEGLPGATLEAALLGYPVVASDIGPNREVLGPQGRYHTVGDSAGLATALQDLMQDLGAARATAADLAGVLRHRHAMAVVADQELELIAQVSQRPWGGPLFRRSAAALMHSPEEPHPHRQETLCMPS